jgi:hypothetical protein
MHTRESAWEVVETLLQASTEVSLTEDVEWYMLPMICTTSNLVVIVYFPSELGLLTTTAEVRKLYLTDYNKWMSCCGFGPWVRYRNSNWRVAVLTILGKWGRSRLTVEIKRSELVFQTLEVCNQQAQ